MVAAMLCCGPRFPSLSSGRMMPSKRVDTFRHLLCPTRWRSHDSVV